VIPPRCSSVSLALGEPQHATASIVRSWVLVEQPGPWGPNAPNQSRMPRSLARWLRARSAELGFRVVALRRPGPTDPSGRHVFVAHSGGLTSWMEHSHLPDPRALMDVDLSPLARGEAVGLGPRETRPVYLVCTNGRRDPCCAERGRPLARAVAEVLADRTWECSHIGGDRFAGNVVCLPHGVYLGRVRSEDAETVIGEYEAGRIALDHYRGRSCYDFVTQAAEHFVRRRHGLRGIDDLTLVGRDGVMVEFADPVGDVHRVRVVVGLAGEPRPLTCHAHQTSRPPTFEVPGPE
jgi:hypothetical protein